MKKIRIFIIEEFAIIREALISLLSQDEGLDVVGSEGDPKQALKRIYDLKPDVMITELSMPYFRGQQFIDTITKHNPETKTIVLTRYNSNDHIRSSLSAGADAYVLKEDTHQDLVVAIHSVMKGNSYLSPGICTNIIHGYLECSNRIPVVTSSNIGALTKREREIIKLIADGKSNSEIAALLSISSKTVEKHRSNMMKKLNLHNAAVLTKHAIENYYQ